MCDRVFRSAAVLSLLVAASVSAGCGGDSSAGDRPKRVPAGGIVNYNGQPVADATVIFVPDGHQHAAVGRTDSSGRFQLQTFEANDGAVPGEYKVSVRKVEVTSEGASGGDDDAETEEAEERSLLPERYASAESSQLTASVKEGESNDFPFELTDD